MATEDTVSVIAKALGESDEIPLTQIGGVVRALGEEQANKLLAETKEIQDKGGMMLPDGSRKRSPGGVFFFLSRQHLSPEDKHRIFRAPKPSKPANAAPEPTAFPRRARVIDVAPARPPASGGKPPRPGFLPPELPVAVKRVRVREAIHDALAALPGEDQYGLLLDVLAELHERLGYRAPDSQRSVAAFDPPTRPGAGDPVSSQHALVPESTTRISNNAPPPVAEEKPRRTATRAKRSV